MKKFLKRMTAFGCALALVIPMLLVPNIDAKANETLAFLRFVDGGWSIEIWDNEEGEGFSRTNATVNGPGTYKVGLEFDEPVDGTAFFSLEIANGEALYPDAYINIESFLINGEEVEIGEYFTNNEEENIRVNLFNEWADADNLPADARRSGDNASPTPVPNDIEGISSIEITFTLDILSPSAFICYAATDWAVSYWGGGDGDIAIDGYGTYTATVDFDEPGNGIEFFDIEIAAGQYFFPDTFMQIDEVKINGEAVNVGTTYSNYEGGNLRTNLYNGWVSEVTEGITTDGNNDGVTPTPVSNDVETVSSIEVTFTLMAGVAFGSDDEEDYAPPTQFNAFMMFQDNGGGEWSKFEPIEGNESWILGDGVWEVSLTREQAGGTGQAIPDESGFVFLVDIVELGKAMRHIGTLGEENETDMEASVEIFVDGEKVSGVKNENMKFGDIEGNGRLRLELVNTWGTGTLDNPVAMPSRLNPENEIKVIFTLKGTGFNSDYDWSSITEEVAVETPVTLPAEITPEEAAVVDDNDKNNTLLIVIIVLAVIACAGGAFVIISKKKKAN